MVRPQRQWLKRMGAAAFLGLIISGAGFIYAPAVSPVLAHTSEEIAAEVERLRQSGDRWLQVDLSSQRLYAWEGDTPVYAVIVSTGKPSTPTVRGYLPFNQCIAPPECAVPITTCPMCRGRCIFTGATPSTEPTGTIILERPLAMAALMWPLTMPNGSSTGRASAPRWLCKSSGLA